MFLMIFLKVTESLKIIEFPEAMDGIDTFVISFKVLVTPLYAFIEILLNLLPVILNGFVVVQYFKKFGVNLFTEILATFSVTHFVP